jgi:hypothetical protein
MIMKRTRMKMTTEVRSGGNDTTPLATLDTRTYFLRPSIY